MGYTDDGDPFTAPRPATPSQTAPTTQPAPPAAARPSQPQPAARRRPDRSDPPAPGARLAPARTATLPCRCDCGCHQPTALPALPTWIDTPIEKNARCSDCLRDHAHNADIPDDAALDRLAAQQHQQTVRDKELTAWRDRLPARFRDATTTHPIALDRLKRLRVGKPTGLLVYGEVGGGKTHIGYGFLNTVVHERLLRPQHILFGTETDLLGSIAMAPYAEREARRRHLIHPRWRLVMIDDVGYAKFPRPEDQWSLWHELLNHLHQTNRSVIVTTNRDGEELKDWLGHAAWDRLRDLVGMERITVNDGNMREKYAQRFETAWRDQQQPTSTGDPSDAPVATQADLLDL